MTSWLICNFRRSFPEGICLALISEFAEVLNGKKYSILPLKRLCESNPLVAEDLKEATHATLSTTHNFARNMLRRKADQPSDAHEVLSRPGLGTGTLDDDGNVALFRPINQHRTAVSQATKGIKRKGNPVEVAAAEKRTLNNLTVTQLKQLAAVENVMLPAADTTKRLLKADIIRAICEKRHPAATLDIVEHEQEGASGIVHVEEDMISDNERDEEDAAGMAMAKKIIEVNSVNELKTIVLKEKIIMGRGRKTKQDYIDAIYLARKNH